MAHRIPEQARAARNIARFQERLKTETDVCERKLLEGLIVLETVKSGRKQAFPAQ